MPYNTRSQRMFESGSLMHWTDRHKRQTLFLCFLILPLGFGPGSLAPASAQPPRASSPQAPSDRDESQDRSPLAASESANSVDAEYFDLLKVFVDTLDEVERNYVKELDRRELLEAAIDGLLAKLDTYSDFIPPGELDQFSREVTSQFGGIGIQVAIEKDWLTVVSPLYGTPAYAAGILAGDRILEINGKSTEGYDIATAVREMKGRVGTKVQLKVRHIDRSEQTLEVRRAVVKVETVVAHARNKEDQWDFLIDPDHKIGYIRITGFSRQTPGEVKRALDKLTAQGMRALVLDLRFNPGGLLTAAIAVSDLFLKQGRIVSTEGRNVPSESWDATSPGTYGGFPMVVLANHYSASASEIVAAALQDQGRAIVVGQRTWGKGSVQKVIDLEGGRSALKLTTSSYLRPNGKNIHRFENASDAEDWGVRPNSGFDVALTPQETYRLMQFQRDVTRIGSPVASQPIYIDRQLQRGLEHLRKAL